MLFHPVPCFSFACTLIDMQGSEGTSPMRAMLAVLAMLALLACLLACVLAGWLAGLRAYNISLMLSQ